MAVLLACIGQRINSLFFLEEEEKRRRKEEGREGRRKGREEGRKEDRQTPPVIFTHEFWVSLLSSYSVVFEFK